MMTINQEELSVIRQSEILPPEPVDNLQGLYDINDNVVSMAGKA